MVPCLYLRQLHTRSNNTMWGPPEKYQAYYILLIKFGLFFLA